jgi:cytochrome c oxidase cbb3-type subunit 2
VHHKEGLMNVRPVRLAAALLLAILPLSACSKKPASRTAGSLTPPFLELSVDRRLPASPASVELGKKLYQANCIQCHGAGGAGDGYGAPFLVPRPRDFTGAAFKFRTTGSGELPTDDDLFRTISRGANGTGMPPWQFLLTSQERWALVDYVKGFSPEFSRRPAPQPIAIPKPPKKAADPARGKVLYAKLQCAKCHGEDGRGAGPSALTLTDSKGFHVNSRDFTNPGSFRTGWTAREIVRTFETGLNGTPMPSYAGLMSRPEEYDLAAYVMAFAGPGSGDQKRQAVRSMEGLGKPDRVISLREHAWKYEPSEIHIKRGEVVRIDYSTTDNGLGAGHGFAIDGLDQAVFVNGAMVGAPLSVTFKIDEPGRYKYYCATQCSTTELHPHMNGVLVVE